MQHVNENIILLKKLHNQSWKFSSSARWFLERCYTLKDRNNMTIVYNTILLFGHWQVHISWKNRQHSLMTSTALGPVVFKALLEYKIHFVQNVTNTLFSFQLKIIYQFQIIITRSVDVSQWTFGFSTLVVQEVFSGPK